MPKTSEQFAAMPDDQQDTFASFVVGAIRQASPGKNTFLTMLRLACNHRELQELERVLAVQDSALRGGLFSALVGEVLSRTSRAGVIRYMELGAKR